MAFTEGDPPTFAGVNLDCVQIFLTNGQPAPLACSVYFVVDNADELCAWHRSNGLEIVEPLRDQPYRLREYAVRDLDGYYLYFGHRSQPALTAAQALPLTCAQAWIASEKDYAKMRAVVISLAKVSLVNRDLTFPNQRDAGVDAGRGIAADCKADPHALLFAIVDKHVRRVAGAIRS